MSEIIPLSVPSIQGNEWKYIKECLDTEWVSSAGKYVNLFEQKVCEFTGAKYAVSCVNGTAALQVALQIVGVKPKDEVIVPTLTFISPVNVVKYLNAEPIFMDCDAYYNIDVDKTIQFLEQETETRSVIARSGATRQSYFCFNKKTGHRISAIIPVHIFGNACNLEKLIPICKERNIRIIEDATESLGTYYTKVKYKNKYTGTIGDIGCYSFNGNKIITTGGGGMIVTDNKEYADKARYLTTQAKDDEVRYIHNEIGYNFRLTNIQAAMGVAQLEQLPEFLKIKTQNFELYKEDTDNIQLKIYTLIQLASWLLSKTSQLESNQISDEIDYLTSLVELIEKDKSNIEKNIDKIKKSYGKVYNELINNKKTSEDFSKYQKDLQIK